MSLLGLEPKFNLGWSLLISAIAHGLLLWQLPLASKLILPPKPKNNLTIVRLVSLPKAKTEIPVNFQIGSQPKLALGMTVPPLAKPNNTIKQVPDVSLPPIAIATKVPEPVLPPPAKPVPEPSLARKPKTQPNPAPAPRSVSKPAPQPDPVPTDPAEDFTQTLAQIYAKYGVANLIPRQIAPAEALINPDLREPGIEWIPPVVFSPQSGSATVILLVDSAGQVLEEITNLEDPPELRRLAAETVKNYYDKFQPLDPELGAKLRLVTIKFDFG